MYTSEQSQSLSISQQCDVSESLYSRQLLVLGPQAHKKLSTSKILVICVNGLSQEICKNLILAGANVDICNLPVCENKNGTSTLSMCESPFFSKADCLTAYYGRENQIKTGISRTLAELNHFVRVNVVNIDQILIEAGINHNGCEKGETVLGLSIEEFSQYSLVITANIPLPFSYKLNIFLRSLNLPMIVAEQRGFSGYAINDFIRMRSVDLNGESCKIGSISRIERKGITGVENNEVLSREAGDLDSTKKITSQSNGMVLINHIFTTIERHNLECSNLVVFSGRVYRIKVHSPFTFEINTDHKIEADQFEEVKDQKTFDFPTIKESVEKKIQEGVQMNLEKHMPAGHRLTEVSLMAFYEALGVFTQKYGRLPNIYDETDCQVRLCEIFRGITRSKYQSSYNIAKKDSSDFRNNSNNSRGIDPNNDTNLYNMPDPGSNSKIEYSERMPSLELFSFTSRALFQPVISIIGGFVAQEALKCVSERFTPSQEVFSYDCSDILNYEGGKVQDFTKCALNSQNPQDISDDTISQMAAENFIKSKREYDPNSPFIDTVFQHLYILFLERAINVLSSNVFLVGAGAIGCEHLKNLYGNITITDMDTIEESNLNRQFLFRKPDIGQFKSDCAKKSILNMRDWWYTEEIKKILTDFYGKALSRQVSGKENENNKKRVLERTGIQSKELTRLGKNDFLRNLMSPKVPVSQSTLDYVFVTDKSEILAKLEESENIVSYKTPVNPSTENIFSDRLLSSFSLIALALDNAEAREYMDSRAVSLKVPLFDSGTLGTKGHTQTVLPFLTESYGSSRDPPEKDIPLCTIRNFPHLIEHCVEWGLAQFNELFVHDTPADIDNPVKPSIQAESEQLDEKIRNSGTVSPIKTIHLGPPRTLDACEKYAKDLLDFYFFATINDLISLFPRDHITEEGLAFWEPPKKFPRVLDMEDPQLNEFIRLFVRSCTKLLSDVWMVNQNEHNRTDIKSTINHIIDTNGKCSYETNKDSTEPEPYTNQIKHTKPELNMDQTDTKKNTITFEKDLDSNQHINFIYAASNLRAYNYRIKQTSRLEVKRIAGRIIPAIATTTAVISGLSCIEMYRYMLNYQRIYRIMQPYSESSINQSDQENEEDRPLIKLRRYRIPFRYIKFINSYINLALPFTSFSEPLAPSTRDCDIFNCKFNLWDEMIIRNCTISQILAQSERSKQLGHITHNIDKNNSNLYDTPTQNVLNNLEPGKLPQFDQSVYLYMPPSIDMLSLNDRIIFCSWDNKKYEHLLEQKIIKKNEGKKRLDILFEKDCMECPLMWIGEEE